MAKLRFVILGLCCGVVGLLPTAASARTHRAHAAVVCANSDAAANQASVETMRAAVVCLINKQRAAHGLVVLRHSFRLDHSAQGWTNRMVSHSLFSHGSDFAARITAAGLRWSSAGENIATGFLTPAEVVDAWMKSTGHCQNILSPNYSFVGTGVNSNPVSGYASGPATWTQDFALPMGQRAPSGNSGPAAHCPY